MKSNIKKSTRFLWGAVFAIVTLGGLSAITWDVGTINSGAGATMDVYATVNSGTAGTSITNGVKISHDQTDTNITPDDPTETLKVLSQDTDLFIEKKVDNSNPNVGDVILYTITVTNNGPVDITSLIVYDYMPPELNVLGTSTSMGVWYAPDTWKIGSLGVGQTATLELKVEVTSKAACQKLTNYVKYSMDQNDNNKTPDIMDATIVVPCDTDLYIEKKVDNTNPNPGDVIVYTINVTNNGPMDVTGLIVYDYVPAGLNVLGGSPNMGNWYNPDTWKIGDLAVGQTATLEIKVEVDKSAACQKLTNQVKYEMDQKDNNITPDILNATIGVNCDTDIAIYKSVDNNTPNEGDTVEFTIKVVNNGPMDASNVVITDVLPAGLTFVSETHSIGTWAAPQWTIGTLTVGQGEFMTIKAKVNSGTAGTAITNKISNTQDQTDNNNTVDDPEETIKIGSGPDIFIGKTVDNPTPNEGDTVKFTVKVVNNGPGAITNVKVYDVLPTGLTLQSVSVSQGTWIP